MGSEFRCKGAAWRCELLRIISGLPIVVPVVVLRSDREAAMGRWVWAPTVSGPLAGHATGFERWLRTRGFSGSAVSQRIWQFDHLSRWLDREGFALIS